MGGGAPSDVISEMFYDDHAEAARSFIFDDEVVDFLPNASNTERGGFDV